MKISVVFPSVLYREGAEGVVRFVKGIEKIGFDELDMFDHVVMGYPTDSRSKPFYSPQMPIVEAFMLLAYAAAQTSRIKLGTSVLVLPQRHPTLVAKQVSTLDTLSGGRVKLGVGSGWQASEYEALGEDFSDRGKRMDECIEILRAYWGDEHVNFQGEHYQIDEMAMEPKPPQGRNIPIWIGGTKAPALRRVARLGDGWMAMNAPRDAPLEERLKELRGYIDEAGRDPASVGLQMSLSPGPLDKEQRKRFFSDPDLMLDRLIELKAMGFQETSIDCVPIFQHGYRTCEAILGYLEEVYEKLEPALG
jgi:probable F420-dependent oxidoreductase